MRDGKETVQIACGELRWEGARKHAGRGKINRAGSFAGRERDSMLDGEEIEIVWGEFRWEGARQHAGRRGKCSNRLRRASLGGSETACWTETKP